jgi:rhamnose transport system ATP-binding protein
MTIVGAGSVILSALEMRDISKYFGAVKALSHFTMALKPGEIHALVGENGAGKSTLIKIMTGVHQPTGGEILVNNIPVTFKTTQDARDLGIVAIYQEPMVFPDLDVVENIFISDKKGGAFVNWRQMRSDAYSLMQRLGLSFDLERDARSLTLAEQQTVEIARALSMDAKVIIMDEPTASLSAHEARQLRNIAKTLKAEGVAIVYISHRLEEVFEIADHVTVLRDGQFISTRDIGEVTTDSLISEMVGREVGEFFARVPSKARDNVRLAVRNLGREGVFEDISFDLRAGEILCMAGLIGARRTDVALSIFGIAPATSGEIEVEGKKVDIQTPKQAMALGVAYVSEDRRKLGLVMPMPIFANASLATLDNYLSSWGLLQHNAELSMAEAFRLRLNIRTPSVTTDVADLSGGNQQKVMLAKWLNTRPGILIFDEPTRGIDVGAKAEVHKIIHDFAADGGSVLLISSDLPEVLALADRILVMREGRQMGIFDGDSATQLSIMSYATGQNIIREAI